MEAVSFKRHIAVLGAILIAITFLYAAPGAHASPVTFAQFQQASNSNNAGFEYLDNGPSSDSEFFSTIGGTAGAQIPVIFNYLNFTGGVPADLSGAQFALLKVKTSTTQPVITAFGGALGDQQNLGDGLFTDTMQILRTNAAGVVTPAAEGTGAKTNLLSMTFTGQLDGAIGGRTAQLSGSTALNYTVNFTSDFLTFPNGERDFSFTFTSWTSMGDGGGLELSTIDSYFASALANGTGTFDATANFVPEPGIGFMGMIGASALLLVRNRRKLSVC